MAGRPTTLAQRTAGAVLISLVVLLVLGITRLSSNQVSGSPTAQPIPPAPSADLCIDGDSPGQVVPCTAPHTADILAAWGTQDAHVLSQDSSAVTRDCWERGQSLLRPRDLARTDPYAGILPPPTWSPVPLVIDAVIITSAADALPEPWVACVLKPRSAVTPDIDAPLARVGQFRGDVTSLEPMTARPLNLRSCYQLRQSLPTSVSCRAWHRGEIIATRSAPAGEAATDTVDLAACSALASDITGDPDPTRAGQLVVDIDRSPAADQIPRLPTGQLDATLLRCVVEAPDSRFLTDSVIGLGQDAVPLN